MIFFYFYFWETWPYALKQNYFFYSILFFCFTENRYFNTKLVSLQNKNTNQCWLKYSRKQKKYHRFFETFLFFIFYFLIFFWAGPSPAHVAGLDLANIRSWAGPSQPSLVTGPCQWPASLLHARVTLYACMNSAKVIKLPSHCSSSCLQYNNRTKRRNHRVIAALVSLRFLFFFYILNMHHLVMQELWHRTYLVSRRWRWRWCCVIYVTGSSASVWFDYSALPFAFSIFLCSLLSLPLS
jgi:hypothetical protein